MIIRDILCTDCKSAPAGKGGYDYEYFITDHLGNTRIRFDQHGVVLQDVSYYPFGLPMGNEITFENTMDSPKNDYLYGGKELQKDFDLSWYDYEARYYDPVLGSFVSVDPLSEDERQLFYSVYSAFWNNPTRYNDPDGKCPDCPYSTFGFGLTYGGGGFSANINFSLNQKFGDFKGSYGIGISYYSNFFNTNQSGFEIRNSFMAGYDNGNLNIGLGTNFWNGMGQLERFNQRTGVVSFNSGDFGFSYENDGTPFGKMGLGDNGDSYRTAAASIRIGELSLNMNLFTGLRNQTSFDIEKTLPGGKKGISQGVGQYGETYAHGFVYEQGPKYRYGGLTVNYQGLSSGLNSEWIRHSFQNVGAHHFIQPQRQFQMQSANWSYIYNISGFSKFSSWGR